MSKFSVPMSKYKEVLSAVKMDYEDGDISKLTSSDIVEIMDASGI